MTCRSNILDYRIFGDEVDSATLWVTLDFLAINAATVDDSQRRGDGREVEAGRQSVHGDALAPRWQRHPAHAQHRLQWLRSAAVSKKLSRAADSTVKLLSTARCANDTGAISGDTSSQ